MIDNRERFTWTRLFVQNPLVHLERYPIGKLFSSGKLSTQTETLLRSFLIDRQKRGCRLYPSGHLTERSAPSALAPYSVANETSSLVLRTHATEQKYLPARKCSLLRQKRYFVATLRLICLQGSNQSTEPMLTVYRFSKNTAVGKTIYIRSVSILL